MNKFYTITFTLLCLISASKSLAQTDSLIYFFDKNFEPVTREKTIYVGIAVKQGDLYKLNIYDNQSEKMVITGYYEDSMLKISEGLFQYFELDGSLTERGTFVKGKKEGLWLSFYRSGKVKDSAYYEKDNWVSKYEYRDDGSILREAHRNGKKLEQKEYRENGKLSLYQGFGEDGKMAFQGGYDENGELVKPFSNKEIEALKKDNSDYSIEDKKDYLQIPSNTKGIITKFQSSFKSNGEVQ